MHEEVGVLVQARFRSCLASDASPAGPGSALSAQNADGSIVDGFSLHTNKTFTNTVETDQETSFVQALATYIRVSGDLQAYCRGLLMFAYGSSLLASAVWST